MALPGMDLQSQYNQTLQNTIGQSQAERLRQTRQQQSIANTDWQQRGVGEGAKRMAGFQEVNPSAMPNMSDETRSFIQPLLGNYQEGGKQVEGYYGSANPYTQGGLESLLSKQGYARAPSSLGEQFKSVGLKLPNAYGQDYYNASHEDVGNKISAYQNEQATKRAEYERQLSQIQAQQAANQALIDELYSGVTSSTADWQSRYAPAKASIEKYIGYGFRPGESNGDWIWYPGSIADNTSFRPNQQFDEKTGQRYWDYGYVPKMSDNDRFLAQYSDDGWGAIQQNNHLDPNGYKVVENANGTKTAFYNSGKTVEDWDKNAGKHTGGYWLNKDEKIVRGLVYNPMLGFGESDFDSPKSGLGKIMPALTMTALGAMFGGAGALAGGGAGTVGGAIGQGIGAAIPSTIQTGASTGDWGKALSTGGINALAGGLGGAYGGDLAKTLGLSGTTGTNIAKGLISGTVNTLGKSALSGSLDYKNALINTLSNIAAPYLGDLTKNAVGGTGGDILGGAVGGFSGNALKNILQGKSLDIGTALSTLQGATGGLGKLFSNTNEDKQSVNGPTSLARTLQGVKNGPAATSRRT